jgi:hypothetical protein
MDSLPPVGIEPLPFPATGKAPGNAHLLAFGRAVRGPKTQVKNHIKKGFKGQRKGPSKGVFLANFSSHFRAFRMPKKGQPKEAGPDARKLGFGLAATALPTASTRRLAMIGKSRSDRAEPAL